MNVATKDCWVCSRARQPKYRKYSSFQRLHLAAAKSHGGLVKGLRKRREGVLRTGRTAKLVLAANGHDVSLFYRWYRPRGASPGKYYGDWHKIATLTATHVDVTAPHGVLTQGERQRINDVLAHRGGSAYLFSWRRSLVVHYTNLSTTIAIALAEDDNDQRACRERWYMKRHVPVAPTMRFFADRDPEGVARWPKHTRRPTFASK